MKYQFTKWIAKGIGNLITLIDKLKTKRSKVGTLENLDVDYEKAIVKPTLLQYLMALGLFIIGLSAIIYLKLFDLFFAIFNNNLSPAQKGSAFGTILGSLIGLYFMIYRPLMRLLTEISYSDLMKLLDDKDERNRVYAGKILSKEQKKGKWSPKNEIEELKFLRACNKWTEIFNKDQIGLNFAMQSLEEEKAIQGVVFSTLEKDTTKRNIHYLIEYLSKSKDNNLNKRIIKYLKKSTGENYDDVKSWEQYLTRNQN